MMNSLLAVAATAIVASVIPGRVHAQDDVYLRNDCRLASQILRTGHPVPHREWAWSVIPSCRDSAGSVLAAVWSDPPEGELSQLWGVSYRVRDARLTRTVVAALRDPSRSRAVRIVAARVLASHAAPNLVVLDSDLPALLGDSINSVYLSVDHSDVREGSVRVAPELVGEIRAALTAVAENDSDPEVRSAARAVATQVARHLRT